jgi:hypothetical protein
MDKTPAGKDKNKTVKDKLSEDNSYNHHQLTNSPTHQQTNPPTYQPTPHGAPLLPEGPGEAAGTYCCNYSTVSLRL